MQRQSLPKIVGLPYKEVDNLSNTMSKNELAAVIYNMARTLSEQKRENFLFTLRKQRVMVEYKALYSRRSAFHKELRALGMTDARKRK